jgi:hypothetical protein
MKKITVILMLGCIGYLGVSAQNTTTSKKSRKTSNTQTTTTTSDTGTTFRRQGDTLIDTKAKNSTNNMNDQYKP